MPLATWVAVPVATAGLAVLSLRGFAIGYGELVTLGAAVLYAEQLPPAFFDLSSRVAGEALQRLRNYGVRLAVVVPPGWAGGSSRFGEMFAEERRGRDFVVVESRAAAVRWLTT